MLAVKKQSTFGTYPSASPKQIGHSNQHNVCDNFLSGIRTLFAHALPPKANIIEDPRSPISCSQFSISRSSTETTASMSFIEPVEVFRLMQPVTMNIDSIRRSLNEGMEPKEIITSTLKEQQIPESYVQILTEKALADYNLQKRSTPLKTLPGAKNFIQLLQKNNIDFCFCTNAGKEKTKNQLKKAFNQDFTVFGKCHKGKDKKSQITARMLSNQYPRKILIVIGNELNDFKFNQDLQRIGAKARCILVGEHSKRPITNIDILKDPPYFSFNVHDYENGFNAAKKLIEGYGADNVAVIMDVHGTVLDTADLLKTVTTNIIEQQYDPINFQ